MAAALAPIISGVLGITGLIQSSNQQSEANNLQNQALAAQQPQIDAQNALLGVAKNYNAGMQDAQGFQTAQAGAGNVLSSQLQQLVGKYGSSGGSPGSDTGFNISAANTANNVLDPLKNWEAGQVATEPQRQAQMFDNVFSANSGQVSQEYFQGANMKAPGTGTFQAQLANLAQSITGAQPQPLNLGGGFGSGGYAGNTNGIPMPVDNYGNAGGNSQFVPGQN